MSNLPQPQQDTALRLREERTAVVRRLLSDNLKRIRASLPAHITEGRVCAMAMNCLVRNPKLLDCTPESFLLGVLTCCEMGLEPGGALHQVALIPYGATVTVVPEYRGLIELARRSGEISTIFAEVVHEGDVFEYELGLEPKLIHKPGEDTDKNPWTYVYAVAHLKDGGRQFRVFSKSQVYKYRDRSSNVKNARKYNKETPWDTDEEAMACKTAIRHLVPVLPASVTDLRRAVDADNRADAGLAPMSDIIDMGDAHITVPNEPEPEKQTPTTAEKVKAKMAKQNHSTEPPVEGPDTMDEIPAKDSGTFKVSRSSWSDDQNDAYSYAVKEAKAEGFDDNDAHDAGYKAATA